MGSPAGCCGSCVFANDDRYYYVSATGCKIWDDPMVQETYREFTIGNGYTAGVCTKYQLNPAALED